MARRGSMSWAEWHSAAEHEAARTFGKKHANWYLAKRFAGPVGIAVLLGMAGLGAWWLWNRVSDLLATDAMVTVSTASPTFPWWLAAAGFLLMALTAFALRPRWAPTSPGGMWARFGLLAFAWLGLMATTAGVLL